MDVAATPFIDPEITLSGERRAEVGWRGLKTLWFNTGTLCNLTCAHCYIESSPRNDRLAYLSADEVAGYLDELAGLGIADAEIGFTGGEPFMNPAILAMIEDSLRRGFRVLVLTNAMKPMRKCAAGLLEMRRRFGGRLALRVSVDHYTCKGHEAERGPRSWRPMIEGLVWLAQNGFTLSVAGRRLSGEGEAAARAGYARLFAAHGLALDADDREALVLFPEMDPAAPAPEITAKCWNILGVDPADMMCAGARMVVKRRGAARPTVVACTLLAYDRRFELGARLDEARRPVRLNHLFCAQFCVLGGGSCSTPA